MAEWLCSGLQLRVHRFDSVLSLQIMKILVTGSSGFIGFHLIKKLLNEGHKVTGIDNISNYYCLKLKKHRTAKLLSKNFKFVECDINHINLEETDFDLAINLAAQAGVRVPKKMEHLYEHSNIQGFKSFCNFCLGHNINKVIYASSSSVYSDGDLNKFCENFTNLKPKSKYGMSKLANERYASRMVENNDFSMVGLRFFSVYGPFGRPDMAYYSFTEALKRNNVISLNNEGNMYRDMTYIEDIIHGILGSIKFVIDSKNVNKNEIFNLGNDCPVKTIDLLRFLERRLNMESIIKNIESKNESIRTHADITKAKNLLGYDPKVDFNDGINSFLNWHDSYEA